MTDPKGETLAYRMGWRINHEDVALKGDLDPTVGYMEEPKCLILATTQTPSRTASSN